MATNLDLVRNRIVHTARRAVNGRKTMRLSDWCETYVVDSDGKVYGKFLEQIITLPLTANSTLPEEWDGHIMGHTEEGTRATGYYPMTY